MNRFARLDTLDAMRGIAAILVLIGHFGQIFPAFKLSSHLAVDFFFLLSGYVVARAYDRRLTGGGYFRTFAQTRLIRLYPLFALGLVLAIIGPAARVFAGDQSPFSAGTLLRTAGLEAFMFPARAPPFGLFPLNAPAWSLFFEIVINLSYGAVALRLTTKRLAAVVIVAGIGIIGVAVSQGSLDAGWSWHSAWAGVVRVGFSFPLGVLIHRLGIAPKPQVSWRFLVAPIFLAGALLAPTPGAWRCIYDPVFVLLASPALLLTGATFEPPEALKRFCSGLGETSYPVYALHYPLLFMAFGAAARYGIPLWGWSPVVVVGFPFLALVVSRTFDVPARRLLTSLCGDGFEHPSR